LVEMVDAPEKGEGGGGTTPKYVGKAVLEKKKIALVGQKPRGGSAEKEKGVACRGEVAKFNFQKKLLQPPERGQRGKCVRLVHNGTTHVGRGSVGKKILMG